MVFWRPPRRKCGSQHASHPAVAVAAPPHAARDPRGLSERPPPSAATVALRPPRPPPLSPPPRGHRTLLEPRLGAAPVQEEAGNLGLPSGGAQSSPASVLRSPEGQARQPQGTEFSPASQDTLAPESRFAETLSTGKPLERWGRKDRDLHLARELTTSGKRVSRPRARLLGCQVKCASGARDFQDGKPLRRGWQ